MTTDDELNTTESGDSSDFACPWCGAQQHDMWEVVADHTPIEFDCGGCGKPIVITAVDWDWTAYFRKGTPRRAVAGGGT